ncbi:hypothetical protein SNEBB_007931 [Seison nebaliae]|nr:hypothetical protein SNEBB_007931 [Seison nebaliae]
MSIIKLNKIYVICFLFSIILNIYGNSTETNSINDSNTTINANNSQFLSTPYSYENETSIFSNSTAQIVTSTSFDETTTNYDDISTSTLTINVTDNLTTTKTTILNDSTTIESENVTSLNVTTSINMEMELKNETTINPDNPIKERCIKDFTIDETKLYILFSTITTDGKQCFDLCCLNDQEHEDCIEIEYDGGICTLFAYKFDNSLTDFVRITTTSPITTMKEISSNIWIIYRNRGNIHHRPISIHEI